MAFVSRAQFLPTQLAIARPGSTTGAAARGANSGEASANFGAGSATNPRQRRNGAYLFD
jgi:hypothetical protein